MVIKGLLDYQLGEAGDIIASLSDEVWIKK